MHNRRRTRPHILMSIETVHLTVKWRGMVTAVAAGLLTACVSGPAFVRPSPPDVQAYSAPLSATQTDSAPLAPGMAPRIVVGLPVGAEWWHVLGSASLDSLISRAFVESPTLAAAEATLRQAQELVRARSGSTQYPQADLSAGAQRVQMNPAALGQSGEPREFSLTSASVGIRYRLDLSGANRRALEALAARADYQAYQLQGARLALSAAIASAAVHQGQAAALLEATQAILGHQEEELHIAEERLRLGAASRDEVLAMRSRVSQTRASIAMQRTQVQQNDHLLSVLAGRAPGEGRAPSFTLTEFAVPQTLPLVVPSELVRRRPDIQGAEALMRAAHAEYGAAVAKLYPQLDLSAALGAQSATASTLFGSGSLIWNLVSQLTQPLLNPGLPAERRAALAAFDAASAHYETVVLESLRSMADVLVALERGAQAFEAWVQADQAAQEEAASVRRQYALGAVSYRELLQAEQRAVSVHSELVIAQAQRLTDTVTLYQALGGGLPDDSAPPRRATP